MSMWGRDRYELSARAGNRRSRASAECTGLVSADCLRGQEHSCMPMAQPPGSASSRHPWLWAQPRDPCLQTGLIVPKQSPRPCRQPRPLLTALPQECMTLDEDCVIQETFHVFLGACSGNVARTAVHPAVHILGQLPEFRWAAQASHVLSLEGPGPWEGPRPTTPPPAWELRRPILGLGSCWLGEGSFQRTEVTCPPPRPRPRPTPW